MSGIDPAVLTSDEAVEAGARALEPGYWTAPNDAGGGRPDEIAHAVLFAAAAALAQERADPAGDAPPPEMAETIRSAVLDAMGTRSVVDAVCEALAPLHAALVAERDALRDLARRTARHLRTLPEQTQGRDVALAAELERAAAALPAPREEGTA
jgi:hypothetical protein